VHCPAYSATTEAVSSLTADLICFVIRLITLNGASARINAIANTKSSVAFVECNIACKASCVAVFQQDDVFQCVS